MPNKGYRYSRLRMQYSTKEIMQGGPSRMKMQYTCMGIYSYQYGLTGQKSTNFFTKPSSWGSATTSSSAFIPQWFNALTFQSSQILSFRPKLRESSSISHIVPHKLSFEWIASSSSVVAIPSCFHPLHISPSINFSGTPPIFQLPSKPNLLYRLLSPHSTKQPPPYWQRR